MAIYPTYRQAETCQGVDPIRQVGLLAHLKVCLSLIRGHAVLVVLRLKGSGRGAAAGLKPPGGAFESPRRGAEDVTHGHKLIARLVNQPVGGN
jgi:hypothetical protein